MKGKGLLLFVCASSLMAVERVDQSFTGPLENGFIVEGDQWLGQSFRPSFSGVLTAIDLDMRQDVDRAGLFNLAVRPLVNAGSESSEALFGELLFPRRFHSPRPGKLRRCSISRWKTVRFWPLTSR